VNIEDAVVVSGSGFIDDFRIEPNGTLIPTGERTIAAMSELTWPAGTLVPHATDIDPLTGEAWAQPLGEKNLSGGHPLYFSLASFVANMFGLTALPHIVVRFYTNPTGRAARRTNLYVLALITPYYAMLPMFSAVGRVVGPEVLSNGTTDAITVLVGERLIDGIGGELVTAIVCRSRSQWRSPCRCEIATRSPTSATSSRSCTSPRSMIASTSSTKPGCRSDGTLPPWIRAGHRCVVHARRRQPPVDGAAGRLHATRRRADRRDSPIDPLRDLRRRHRRRPGPTRPRPSCGRCGPRSRRTFCTTHSRRLPGW